jgi:Acetyltransferase (GNAT) domain
VRLRLRRAHETDPDGAWVAEADGKVVGVANALRRGPIWVLSLLAVDPGTHGGGHGRTLLRQSLEYADGCRGLMICASTHPAALRLYAGHGFSLLPAMAAQGPVDRALLPPPPAGVRAGTADDLELCAAVDVAIRGGERTVDLEMLLDSGAALFVSGRPRGYALVAEGRCFGVSAEDEPTARALLWTLIAEGSEARRFDVSWITAPQQWAVQVAIAAGLKLTTDGPVCVRGETGPLRPWLPNGALL